MQLQPNQVNQQAFLIPLSSPATISSPLALLLWPAETHDSRRTDLAYHSLDCHFSPFSSPRRALMHPRRTPDIFDKRLLPQSTHPLPSIPLRQAVNGMHQCSDLSAETVSRSLASVTTSCSLPAAASVTNGRIPFLSLKPVGGPATSYSYVTAPRVRTPAPVSGLHVKQSCAFDARMEHVLSQSYQHRVITIPNVMGHQVVSGRPLPPHKTKAAFCACSTMSGHARHPV
ncbi:hypothetical protein NLG97_g4125 [Lecanicillium saksenae]|uniref:Uncharacterized protein n=1 Tax=Lecanicillium saksenae TaxID=468837 RepID=A0ACC1QXV9_9HYPO|nr:hypothetical protein NLG97_g4125 [Lecanicillium saksenae]